jgi:hypothetical protein
VTILVWLLLVLLIAVVAILLFRDQRPGDRPAINEPTPTPSYRLRADLYAIRRRLDVARFRFDVRRDAAEARHRLRAELSELERREGRQP